MSEEYVISYFPLACFGSYGPASSKPDDGKWYSVIKVIYGTGDINFYIFDPPQETYESAWTLAIEIAQSIAMQVQQSLSQSIECIHQNAPPKYQESDYAEFKAMRPDKL